MDKLDKLLIKAKKCNIVKPYEDYDYSRLTESELLELISDDVTEKRIIEILEPVKFINRGPNSLRKKFERLSDQELEEQTRRYEKINQE